MVPANYTQAFALCNACSVKVTDAVEFDAVRALLPVCTFNCIARNRLLLTKIRTGGGGCVKKARKERKKERK